MYRIVVNNNFIIEKNKQLCILDMKKILRNPYFLSQLSALFLFAAWPVNGFFPFVFIGFVPLFYSFYLLKQQNKGLSFFTSTYLGILSWNLLTTWWISYASLGGAILAFFANSLLMAIVFQISFSLCSKNNIIKGLIFFSLLWISFEYLHLRWELTWPWLTLGNVFSENIYIIQWYEFTGVFGGSIWALSINLGLFYLLVNKDLQSKKNWAILGLILFFPIVISMIIYGTYQEQGSIARVQVIQPNIDPYNDKFGGMTVQQQIQKMLNLSRAERTEDLDLIIAPETALPYNIWENELQENEQIKVLQEDIKTFGTPILTGASTCEYYDAALPPTFSSRKLFNQPGFYDSFNSALLLDTNEKIEIYHKSKLVPGVERIPFPGFFKKFESLAIDLGGTTGSLGVQSERETFKVSKAGIIAAPIVCYESIYGEYVGEYVNKGANLLCIITNDGWWDDTPGYKQHLSYARIRAIENRRDIARSANTGMSAFINQRGEITYKSSWWVEASKSQQVRLNHSITFYTKHGDYLALLCMIIGGTFFVILFLERKKEGKILS